MIAEEFLFVADATASDSKSHPRIVPAPRGFYVERGKRVVDLALVVLASPLLIPLALSVALCIRVSLGPGVLYRQRRVGLNGRDFTMLKFRTMHPSRRVSDLQFVGTDRRRTHKHANDPRHTKLGKVLRRLSLDELPQFLNVWRGEMSIVGPRPEVAEVVDRMGLRDHPRHSFTPGLTGYWQTTVRNEGLMLHDWFDLDLPYADRVSLSEDLRIISKTIAVLASPGGQ